MGKLRIKNVELQIPAFGGQNTAKTFSEIELFESPKMLNWLPRKIGGLANRDGTVPLTTTPIAGAIRVLCNLWKAGVNSILATAGTTLYKYAAGVFTAQTMTNPLVSANIDWAQFKDDKANEVLIIADGGSLKFYNGSAVANIPPEANDSTGPTNVLATLNTTSPPVGCIIHHNRVVIWGANSDQINHSKPGFYDYFQQTSFQRFVRENDYVQTCISYSGSLLVMMRRHIGVLFGDGYSSTPSPADWSQDFLDTTDGCVNAKSVALVVYPNGSEEVFYQSDKGVHAVYTINTLSLDSSARFSTKSMTKNQISFEELGLTKAEWQNAVGYFRDGHYWLTYKKGIDWQGMVFDTNDGQWYPIANIKANCFLHDEDYFYFAGDDGHLKVFDDNLFSDWNTAAKTPGTNEPIKKEWYSKLMTPLKLPTGFDHLWDILKIEAKQHLVNSTLDVEVNTFRDRFQLLGAIKTSILIIGVTRIGESQIANINLTDYINNAKRINTFVKGQYAQIKLSNYRDEPMEIFSLSYEVRAMTKM